MVLVDSGITSRVTSCAGNQSRANVNGATTKSSKWIFQTTGLEPKVRGANFSQNICGESDHVKLWRCFLALCQIRKKLWWELQREQERNHSFWTKDRNFGQKGKHQSRRLFQRESVVLYVSEIQCKQLFKEVPWNRFSQKADKIFKKYLEGLHFLVKLQDESLQLCTEN